MVNSIALETAKRETGGNLSVPITMFTDSQEALITIQQSSPRTGNLYLRDMKYHRALDLKDNGRSVTVRRIPGHVSLVGHDRANQSAKDRAH